MEEIWSELCFIGFCKLIQDHNLILIHLILKSYVGEKYKWFKLQ